MSQQSRRSIVKGAAWAAPAVLATATIPAYAASKPALDGWLSNIVSSCSRDRWSGVWSMTYTIDGQVDTYPTRGLWISNAPASATIGATKIIQYISDAAGLLKFQRGGTSNQWSTLAYDSTAPVKSGYIAYTTTFSGTWQYDAAKKLWFPSTRPYFTTTVGKCITALQVITARFVTINSTVYSFERSATLRQA